MSAYAASAALAASAARQHACRSPSPTSGRAAWQHMPMGMGCTRVHVGSLERGLPHAGLDQDARALATQRGAVRQLRLQACSHPRPTCHNPTPPTARPEKKFWWAVTCVGCGLRAVPTQSNARSPQGYTRRAQTLCTRIPPTRVVIYVCPEAGCKIGKCLMRAMCRFSAVNRLDS